MNKVQSSDTGDSFEATRHVTTVKMSVIANPQEQQTQTVIFPLCFRQIRVDGVSPPSQNVLLYETVTVVEGSPILRDMVFSPDYQYTYLLSDKQVTFTTFVVYNAVFPDS